MAVAIDAVNTADGHTTGVSVTTLTNANLTVGSGANRVLWAAMSFVVAGGSAPASRTMTWDAAGANQAMTEVLFVANGTNGWISIFGLIAPTAGNKTLTCSWTNNNGGYLSCASFTGANQTSVAAAFTNTASATGTASPASVAVTSAVGNICAYAFQATSAGDLAVLDATTISARMLSTPTARELRTTRLARPRLPPIVRCPRLQVCGWRRDARSLRPEEPLFNGIL